MCRSRRELSNAYLLAKIGVNTAENEPLEVWGGNFNSIFTSFLSAFQFLKFERSERLSAGKVCKCCTLQAAAAAAGGKKGKKKWSKGKVPLPDIGSTLILFPSMKLTFVCNFASLDIDYLSMMNPE